MINTKHYWTPEQFVDIISKFQKDDAQILFLDIKDGLSSNTFFLIKLLVNNIVHCPLDIDYVKDMNCLAVTKSGYSGDIEPDSYSHIYIPGEDYPYKPTKKTPAMEFKELVLAFYHSAIHTILRIDITTLSRDKAREIIRELNATLEARLKIKFPNDLEAVVYKPGYKQCPLYHPEEHLYKLGEPYPYKPTPPCSIVEEDNTPYYSSIQGVSEKINSIYKPDELICIGARIVGHHSAAPKSCSKCTVQKKYHLHYEYRNCETHDEPTPPWYKQELDICNYIRVTFCNYINPIIVADQLDIGVAYRDNKFFIDIYTPEISESIKKQIDDAIAFPIMSIHSWGDLTLSKCEIKEYV